MKKGIAIAIGIGIVIVLGIIIFIVIKFGIPQTTIPFSISSSSGSSGFGGL